MSIIKNQKPILYAIAFIISFLFFLNVSWKPESPVNNIDNMSKYFGADSSRVIDNLNDSGHFNHYRDRTHPLFSIVAVSVSKSGSYFGFNDTAYTIYKLIFGTFGTFLFWNFIYKNSNSAQAFASMALLLSTMSIRIWSTVPETFLFSFFTIMLALNLMQNKSRPQIILLLTLGGTITNVFLGLVYTVFRYKKKPIIFKIFLSFLILAVTFSIIQQNIYPTSTHFFSIFSHKEELEYFNGNISSISFRFFDFFVSGFIVPLNNHMTLPLTTFDLWQEYYKNELFSSKRGLLFTAVTFLTLLTAYLFAVFVFIKSKNKNPINLSVFIFLCFQLLLHLFYGDDPFLYSLNITPIIIIFFSLNVIDKQNKVTTFLTVLLAFLIQRFNYSDPTLFQNFFN